MEGGERKDCGGRGDERRDGRRVHGGGGEASRGLREDMRVSMSEEWREQEGRES